VPVYAVLTNEQLAAVATKRPASAAALREVEGIGEAKAGKYGSAVLGLMAAAAGETAAGAGKEDKTIVP
jgi:DNA helicase-2/ATP-dependent DNA helicase PcrA